MTDQTLIPVAVACPCPGAPHDGDTVYLRQILPFRSGFLAQRKIIDMSQDDAPDAHAIQADLGELFLREGVADWTFVDTDGNPVEVNEDSIQHYLLDNFAIGFPVANEAAEVYQSLLLDPLVGKASKSSRATQTGASTSRPTTSSVTPLKRSKRSSTSTSQTEDIATTSA
jgi:hypothetical protein